MKRETYIIDATDQPLGRLATRVAVLLRGKNIPGFRPNKESKSQVRVFNTDKIKLTGKKMEQKKYYRHSGYPGGLKEVAVSKVMERDSREVVQRAVYGMLPANKLRDKTIKRLGLFKGEIEESKAQK